VLVDAQIGFPDLFCDHEFQCAQQDFAVQDKVQKIPKKSLKLLIDVQICFASKFRNI
jgi:hypothetical protein